MDNEMDLLELNLLYLRRSVCIWQSQELLVRPRKRSVTVQLAIKFTSHWTFILIPLQLRSTTEMDKL